jgi:O-antigen ligase
VQTIVHSEGTVRWLRIVYGAGVGLLLPVSVVAPKGTVLLLVLTGLAIFALARPNLGALKFSYGLSLPLGLFSLYVAMSSLWAEDSSQSFLLAVIVSAYLMAGLMFVRLGSGLNLMQDKTFLRLCVFGGCVGYVLYFSEYHSDLAITEFMRSFTGSSLATNIERSILLKPATNVAVLYLWPWILCVMRLMHGYRGLLALGLPFLVVSLNVSTSAVLASVGGAFVFALTFIAPKFMPRLLVVAILVFVVLAPFIFSKIPDPRISTENLDIFPSSAIHRLVIWHNTLRLIDDRPVIGRGMDGTRQLYNKKSLEVVHIPGSSQRAGWAFESEPIPLHPHNGVLQIWLELGLAGIVITGWYIVAIFGRIRALVENKETLAIVMAAIATNLVLFSLSFGAWQNWWLSVQVVVAGALGLLIASRSSNSALPPKEAISNE